MDLFYFFLKESLDIVHILVGIELKQQLLNTLLVFSLIVKRIDTKALLKVFVLVSKFFNQFLWQDTDNFCTYKFA